MKFKGEPSVGALLTDSSKDKKATTLVIKIKGAQSMN